MLFSMTPLCDLLIYVFERVQSETASESPLHALSFLVGWSS